MKLDSASFIVCRLLWMLFPIVSGFYCFLLFDIIGDNTGWKYALKVSLLIFGCSVLLLFVIELVRYCVVKCTTSAEDELLEFDGLEMSERSDVDQLEEGESPCPANFTETDSGKRKAQIKRQKAKQNRLRKQDDAAGAAEDCCETLLTVGGAPKAQ
eukprot:gene39821-49212_t